MPLAEAVDLCPESVLLKQFPEPLQPSKIKLSSGNPTQDAMSQYQFTTIQPRRSGHLSAERANEKDRITHIDLLASRQHRGVDAQPTKKLTNDRSKDLQIVTNKDYLRVMAERNRQLAAEHSSDPQSAATNNLSPIPPLLHEVATPKDATLCDPAELQSEQLASANRTLGRADGHKMAAETWLNAKYTTGQELTSKKNLTADELPVSTGNYHATAVLRARLQADDDCVAVMSETLEALSSSKPLSAEIRVRASQVSVRAEPNPREQFASGVNTPLENIMGNNARIS